MKKKLSFEREERFFSLGAGVFNSGVIGGLFKSGSRYFKNESALSMAACKPSAYLPPAVA